MSSLQTGDCGAHNRGGVAPRAQLHRLLVVIATACVLVLQGLVSATVANADVLSNGIEMNCWVVDGIFGIPGEKQDLECHASGCPTNFGGDDPDTIHWMVKGDQNERDYSCNLGSDLRMGADITKPFTFGVQLCQKNTFSKDVCREYADYTWTPPVVSCPEGSESPTVPAGQQCKSAPKPEVVVCPEGSPTKTVTAGQECAPIPDVTNAIQASFGPPGLTSIDFNVKNTSKLDATCDYTATATTVNPLVPKETKRTFDVPANGPHTETFNGAPTFTTYNVVLSCRDASGKQKAELGHVETSVVW